MKSGHLVCRHPATEFVVAQAPIVPDDEAVPIGDPGERRQIIRHEAKGCVLDRMGCEIGQRALQLRHGIETGLDPVAGRRDFLFLIGDHG